MFLKWYVSEAEPTKKSNPMRLWNVLHSDERGGPLCTSPKLARRYLTDQTKSCLHRAYRYRTLDRHKRVYARGYLDFSIVPSVSSQFRLHCEKVVQEGSHYYAHWHFSEQQCLP